MSALGGLILAAPRSVSGKTTITLALLRHFRDAGIRVAGSKSGPDFIDPEFHSAAAGRPCANLDAWAMRPDTLAALVHDLESTADLVLCEGAMGLFDGAGVAAQGSTAALARRTSWPVVLIVDAQGLGASAAALITGFVPDIGGLLFNRVASARHAELLDAALARAHPGLPILGHVPADPELTLPSRHLGLVQASEHPTLERFLDRAAACVGSAVDTEALARLARSTTEVPRRPAPMPIPPLGQRIAVARDLAFAFSYAATLEGWRKAGAELAFFSPLADEAPPKGADAIFLPGGYPELHAGRLATNRRFFDGLQAAAASGITLYGECGGYMVLGHGLVDAAGRRHPMAGLLPLETSFAAKRRHLGYREVTLAQGGPLGRAGARFRGHEFHYASILTEEAGSPLFTARDADGNALPPAGFAIGKVMGSFVHLIDLVSP